ncbi:MAG TPA: DJ-1/PfpI family protein [Polyangiaceae bacterium]|nr:DJ-1/PfpI family protein [Polyangiaceae bacterium]
MRVGIVVFDGFDELDAVGPYEVLRSAEERGAALETKLVALRAVSRVRASHGLAVIPECVLAESFDWLVVAGGAWVKRSEAGVWGEIQRGELPRALAEARRAGVRMAAVCTGTMLLSAAGITRDRRATTHHAALDALQSEGAKVERARVVDDGDLMTCGGVTSGIDMALWFVERHFGTPMADGIATTMEYARSRDIVRSPELARPLGALASTPEPPYYAVIFTRVRRAGDDGYGAMADRLVELVREQPGFLGFESVAEPDGVGMTVSYWQSEGAIRAWRANAEHLEAQRRGREGWYAGYDLRIAKVERAYRFR